MRALDLLNLQISWHRICKVLLFFCWPLGMVLGLIFSAGADGSFLLLMHRPVFSVSIVGLLCVAVLPFLFTAYAVFLSNRFLIIIFAFLKAFAFGYCAFGLTLVYGNSFWLAWILLMFTELGSLPVLMWFWLQCFESPERSLRMKFFGCLTVSALIVWVDYWIVSPFAATIL